MTKENYNFVLNTLGQAMIECSAELMAELIKVQEIFIDEHFSPEFAE